MSGIWYLSPSNQGSNLGVGNYGSEKSQMNLLLDEIIPHLDRAGVSFHRGDPDLTLEQRVKESNDMEAVFHLALHSNAGGKGKARGAVAYYYSETGKQFGEKLVSALAALGQVSNRSSSVKQEKTFYELKHTKAPACLFEVDFHDSEAGVEFLITRRSSIAEAIARVIIEADGKSFVPVTGGEYVDRAVRMGLIPPDVKWTDSLTWEEAAISLVKLIDVIKKEVNNL